ncbi:MAG: T9SS type A sorting domain-containing protein, partial [Ignavibacteriae bacterium]|nr:T9SS type A sorting domain-containing protein [Ignavibacteriota bacterium]
TQGTPQSTNVRTPFSLRFRATVKDAANNPLPNVPVTFTAPTIQPTGKFNGTSNQAVVNTDASGVAEAPVFIADSLVGPFAVNATADQVSSPAVYALTNLPRTAKTVLASGGTPQSAAVGRPFSLPFEATVRDTFGNPVPNVRVRYSYPSSGPTGTFAGNVDTATTNSNGVASSAIFVAGLTAGSYSVTGSVQGVTSPAQYQLTNLAGQAGSIAVVSGSLQQTQINTPFAQRLVVMVRDQANNPVGGAEVTFETPPQAGPSGNFQSGQNTAITGPDGQATSAVLIANSFSGDFVVNASAQGVSSPARFELTNTASAAASVTAIAGTPQSTRVNNPFVDHFKVLVKDAANNPVNGVTVVFRVPSSGASGTFNNNDSTATTNSTGEAEALTFVANAIAGTYTVHALVAGVSTSAEFHLSNTTGSPGRISVLAGGSQQAQVNSLFDTLMQARIVDSSSNPVNGVLVTFTAPSGGASGTFTGGVRTATATTDNNGVATAPAFTANTIAGSYQVSATGAGVAAPAQFLLTNRPGVLNRFAVESEQGGSVGLQLATIPFNVRVSARDVHGNTVNSFSGTVNVTSTGVLSSGGGTTPAFANGSLIRRLAIRKAASSVTISVQRTGGTETGTSNQFNINNPVPSVTSIFPDSGNLMQTLVIRVSGSNFIDSVTTISVGSGITVNGLTVDSSSQLRANITIASNAVVGPKNVIVSNSPPGGGTSQALQFRVDLPLPNPPELTGGPQDGSRNQDTLTTLWWRSSSLAIAYHLQVSTSPSFTLPMFFNDSTLTDTLKSLVLPTNPSTGIAYYWRVRARNATGAGSFSPTKSFTTIPSYPTTFILNTTLPFATKTNPGDYSATEYRIFGLPGDASAVRLRDVMSGTHNADWVAYWDNGASSSNFVAFDGTVTFNFSVGRAFWVLRKGALTVSRSVQTAALEAATRSVNVPLHPGWNLITTPFISQIPWRAIDTANGLGLDTPWKFEGTFSQSTTIEPYKGYYFDNTRSLVNLKIPYGNFSTTALDKIPTSVSTRDRWSVGIELSVDGLTDNSARFGTDPAARPGLDSLEYRRPRAIGVVPSVFFARPDWDASYSTFAADIRPSYDEVETWTFDVQSPVRKQSELRFTGLTGIPENFKAFLIDDRQERFVDLQENSSYTYASPFNSSQFRVVIGTEERVKDVLSSVLPKEFSLGNNFPNPFNPTTTIPVALPHVADVSVKIYSILGEEVQTVFSGTLQPGKHYLTWDGRNRFGNAVATGMYIVRFTTNVGKAFTGKMLLMK